MNVRVKICGLTREQDVDAAVAAGTDAIGLVFYDPSPRAVSVELARRLAARIPAFVSVTGLFVNPQAEFVNNVLQQVPLDLLQFHGDEPAHFCEQFRRRWMKAIRVREAGQIEQAFADYSAASALLVDAWHPQQYGGTGHGFNWKLIPALRPLPLILAGGLSATNAALAVQQVRPWAVDVSGGVETAKGIKCAAMMTDFVTAARAGCSPGV